MHSSPHTKFQKCAARVLINPDKNLVWSCVTIAVAFEQSPGCYADVYDKEKTGPVGMARKFKLLVSYIRALVSYMFDDLADFLILRKIVSAQLRSCIIDDYAKNGGPGEV